MRRSKLESCEAILEALMKTPLTIDSIAYETSIECTALERYLEFLVKNGLIEERFSDDKTTYAITERGVAVFKALNFQKYLEKITKSIRALDDALKTVPILSKRINENEEKTEN